MSSDSDGSGSSVLSRSACSGVYSAVVSECNRLVEQHPSAEHYCNRAWAEFHLELYRKCVKDCDAALALDPRCERAYLRKGHALLALDKKEEAHRTWKKGARCIRDLELHCELKLLAEGGATNAVGSSNGGGRPSITGEPVAPSKSSSFPSAQGVHGMRSVAEVVQHGLVQHGVGDKSIDERIVMGYLQVNTGNYSKGIELFSALLVKNPRIVAAYLGRGTALALSGDLDKAIVDFSSAIRIAPKNMDGWKRRAQARSAKGHISDAIEDITEAIQLDSKDHDNYHQRGLMYHKLKNYRRALDDFRKASYLDKTNKAAWNYMGICLNVIGNPIEAIEAHSRLVTMDDKNKEAWANMAQAYKELGIYEKAELLFQKALSIDGTFLQAYYLRGSARFAAGLHRDALKDFDHVVSLDSSHIDSVHMSAVVKHGLGLFTKAVSTYSSVVAKRPDHFAWYQREIALFVYHHIDIPVSSFNLDRAMDNHFKEAWCKRHHPALLVRYTQQDPVSLETQDVIQSTSPTSPELAEIIRYSREIGSKIQLNCAGYMPNKRQHAACGLAVLELAQRLKGVWFKGDTVVDGKSSSSTNKPHQFGWRDMYDILVKWRQYSEPNDPVWWVDLLSPEQFEEGFGSHTPMITGQTHVVRYYPMFERSFAIMKDLIPEQCNLPAELLTAVRDAQDCKSMHQILRRDFWVVTPCHSTAHPGKIMEGTRLTLQYVEPEGYEYSIRTPGTPPRWKEYDIELSFVWDQLTQEIKEEKRDLNKISDLILSLTFYWYNFMPLSRGTAAVGYMGLLAMFLAIDVEIAATVPKGFQVDWEGILTPRPEEFVKALSAWMYPSRKSASFHVDQLPALDSVCSTIREIIGALNITDH